MASRGPDPDDWFEVVWLDGTDAGGTDEALPEPAAPTRRWLRPAGAAAALLVIAALVTAAVRHDGSGPRADAAATASPSGPPTSTHWRRNDQLLPIGSGRSVYVHDGAVIGPLRGTPVTGPRPPVLDLPAATELLPYVERHVPCPNKMGCAFSGSASRAVERAMRDAVPAVRDIHAASVSESSVLVLRAVRARVGRATVEIVAHPANTGDGARAGTLSKDRIRYVRAVLDGFSVDVQVLGRPTAVSYDALQALAYDIRLRS